MSLLRDLLGWVSELLHGKPADQARKMPPHPPEFPPPAKQAVQAPPPAAQILKSLEGNVEAPPTAKGPRIIIGLDYGTYSTKAVVRLRGETRAQVVLPDTQRSAGYPAFASPSLVRMVDGRVHFGGSAIRKDGGELLRSLKVDMLPPDADSSLPAGIHRKPARDPSQVELVVACYLSWTLDRIREVLDKRYAEHGYRPRLNVAAPMNHQQDVERRKRYLRVVGAAWRSVYGADRLPARDGESLASLKQRFAPLLEGAPDTQEQGERQFEVLPETVAPMVSIHENRDVQPGLFMVVDVGAGTTEMSVIRMGETGGEHRLACYSDISRIFGGDNFHEYAGGPEAKHDWLVDCFRRMYEPTWENARRKDSDCRAAAAQWKKITIILTGGAARRPRIERSIEGQPPWWRNREQFPDFEHSTIWYEPPADVLATDLADEPDRCDFHLLAVAHGLSFEPLEWPRWFPPEEVEALPPQERTDPPMIHPYEK